MAASLGANSLVFAMGAIADPATPGISQTIKRAPLEIEGFRMVFTVVVALGAPAPQSLQLFKGSNNAQAMPTGGTALTALPKRTLDAGGDSGMIADTARIATTAGLTAGTFTRGSVPLATFDIAGVNVAGNRLTFDFFRKWNGESLWLDPGEILVLSNPAALPAVLTWTLSVNVDYRRRDTL
jgi:hypothetical protein